MSDRPNPGLERYAISRRAFRWQMALLRWLGYRCLNLRELVEALEAGEPVAKKTVVLTFDDGYLDTVTEAAPVLQGYGFRATVFAVTTGVGRTAEWDAGYGGEQAPLATWEQLRALQDSGWEVGFHTATHPDLTTLSDNELAEEVVEGKAVFERALGSPVSTIAYPFGEFTPAVVAAARRSGVRAAVAGDGDTDRGAWVTHRSPRYALPRYIIRGSDSLVDLLLLVTIGHRTAPFDWPAVRLPKRGMRLLPGLGRRG